MIRSDIPESNYGANVQIKIPMPRSAISVTTELVGGPGPGGGGGGGAGGAGGAGAGQAGATMGATGQVR